MALIYAVIAFVLWGLSPILWKQVSALTPLEIIANRAIWPGIFCLIWLSIRRDFGPIAGLRRDPKTLCSLLVSAAFMFGNWWIYVEGIRAEKITELSFGYFMSPILTLAIGSVFLKERLNVRGKIALGMVLTGIFLQATLLKTFPFYAVGVASTFAVYAALRKLIPFSPFHAITVESLLMSVVILSVFPDSFMMIFRSLTVGRFYGESVILITTSMIPFFLYLEGLRRVGMVELSYVQYLSPSVKFFVATLFYHETLSLYLLGSFSFVWVGIAIAVIPSLFEKK